MSGEIVIRPTAPAALATIIKGHKRGCDKQAGLTGALNRPEQWPA